MKEINWNKLRDEAHQNAVDKGFWEDEPSIPDCLALIHSEVSEVLEADRKEKHANINSYNIARHKGWDFKGSFLKFIKDTFEDELADIVIRCLDLCGKLRVDVGETPKMLILPDGDFGTQICELHRKINKFYETESYSSCKNIIWFCVLWAKKLNIDILKHIELKMKYNALRPYKHGKRY